MSADIRERTTRLQALVKEVQEWRTEQDPGTAEWHTLIELAEQVEGLLTALPWELQPAPTVDELIEVIGL
ncbi:hypothetical protein ABZ348_31120 [Streptomyces sp. NPDC005963]|uniref:hypothetical protein n=1 Tax=Streptomyces sp. NPDC005963 TaxID=3156721 RepID=UPI00340F01AE